MWRKRRNAKDPKHTASSVKHGGGGVMAWTYMAASGTGPLNFTDDLIYDDSSRMNLEGYKTILPSNIQENATRFIGKCFILHQDNDPKHPASSVKEFIRAKKWKVLDCPSQSPDLNPIEHEFHQLKRRVKTETPQNNWLHQRLGKVFQRMRPRVWGCLWITDSLLWLCARDPQQNNSF